MTEKKLKITTKSGREYEANLKEILYWSYYQNSGRPMGFINEDSILDYLAKTSQDPLAIVLNKEKKKSVFISKNSLESITILKD